MRIVGEWLPGEDGSVRPIIHGKVQAANGGLVVALFLVDTGADRSVICFSLADLLGLAATAGPSGIALQGVGGNSPFVLLATMLEFTADDGTPARIHGQFAAFTDPVAADMSILGRDVLDHFDRSSAGAGTRSSSWQVRISMR